MFEWIRRKLAIWGYITFQTRQVSKYIKVNDHKTVSVTYKYNGDVDIAIAEHKPYKLLVIFKAPHNGEFETINYLEYKSPLQHSGATK